jgi:hypothetical protein
VVTPCVLLAAGAVVCESWLASLQPRAAARYKAGMGVGLLIGGLIISAISLPIAPLNSAWWNFSSSVNQDLKEEIGWPELVKEVKQVRDTLPPADRDRAGILINNYGEAGAINLYGPALGLQQSISGVNSYWLRGFGEYPPQTLIVLGYRYKDIASYFETCELAGKIPNPYGVHNEEAQVPDIFICRNLRMRWQDFWQQIQHFG